jgi:hypothetical protein
MYILTPEYGFDDDAVLPIHRQAALRMLQCLPALARAAQRQRFDLAPELAQLEQRSDQHKLLEDNLFDCMLLATVGVEALPAGTGHAAVLAAAISGGGPHEWALTLACAAQAALQLLHCAAEPVAPGRDSSAPEGLAGYCLRAALHCSERIQHLLYALDHPAEPAPPPLQQQQLGQQLRQLHATACRLVHYGRQRGAVRGHPHAVQLGGNQCLLVSRFHDTGGSRDSD